MLPPFKAGDRVRYQKAVWKDGQTERRWERGTILDVDYSEENTIWIVIQGTDGWEYHMTWTPANYRRIRKLPKDMLLGLDG